MIGVNSFPSCFFYSMETKRVIIHVALNFLLIFQLEKFFKDYLFEYIILSTL